MYDTPDMRPAPPAALAVAGWLALIVLLNVANDLVLSTVIALAGSFACVVARRPRLVGIGVAGATGVLVISPLIAAYPEPELLSLGPVGVTLGELIVALGGAARFWATVVSVQLLLMVRPADMLALLGRLSTRSALVAGLAMHAGPLLRRDLAGIREELAIRGVGGSGPGDRRGLRSAWEALVAGMFERSYATASALHARGVGSGARARGGTLSLRPGGREALLAVRHPERELVVASLSVARLGAQGTTPLSVRVPAGGWLLVTGDSGVGKSSLVEVLVGTIPHVLSASVSGSARMGEVDLVATPPSRRAGLVAWVAQDAQRHTVMGLVCEEVACALRHRGSSLEEIAARTAGALELVGCQGLAHRTTDSLSGGELQQVAIATALAQAPALLVLDEPLAMLDEVVARRVLSAIDTVRQATGMTVVCVEHRSHLVEAHATSRALLGAESQVRDLVPAERAVRPMAGAPPLLQASGMTVRAGDAVVVDQLAFDLRSGELLALTGPVGAGKSTLLRALRGLHPRTGWVAASGTPVLCDASSAWRVAYLPQRDRPALAAETVGEHVRERLPHLPAPVVGRMLADAGLDGLDARHPADLSVGQAQRVRILCATGAGQAVWLLDEPFAALDDTGRAWLRWLVYEHLGRGGACVISAHDRCDLGGLAARELALSGAGYSTMRSVEIPARPPSVRVLDPERVGTA